ncbi:MAG: DUF72 domain-containing protein [Rhodospirillaceae bacterium]
MRAGDVRIGLSGWLYIGWRGTFYPKGLPHRRELSYVGETFRTVEINGTFYSTQAPESFARWKEAVPSEFLFAVKCPRFITHMKRLRNVETPLANFFASGVLRLGEKMGPLLWQFPPNFIYRREISEPFLEMLPRSTREAAKLSRKHDERIRKGTWTKADTDQPIRYAVEIRHESFANEDFIALLRKHNIALVCADTVDWPLLMDVTADFVYCRLHGSRELYKSNYSSDELQRWAKRAAAWAHGKESPDGRHVSKKPPRKRARRDVFIYFDNTDKVMAPGNALELEQRLDKMLMLSMGADPTSRARDSSQARFGDT